MFQQTRDIPFIIRYRTSALITVCSEVEETVGHDDVYHGNASKVIAQSRSVDAAHHFGLCRSVVAALIQLSVQVM